MRALALLPLALCGCLPVSTYYAEGVSFAQLDRDNTRCDVAALRDAPVATQTRQHPPRYIPRQVCNPASATPTAATGYPERSIPST